MPVGHSWNTFIHFKPDLFPGVLGQDRRLEPLRANMLPKCGVDWIRQLTVAFVMLLAHSPSPGLLVLSCVVLASGQQTAPINRSNVPTNWQFDSKTKMKVNIQSETEACDSEAKLEPFGASHTQWQCCSTDFSGQTVYVQWQLADTSLAVSLSAVCQCAPGSLCGTAVYIYIYSSLDGNCC